MNFKKQIMNKIRNLKSSNSIKASSYNCTLDNLLDNISEFKSTANTPKSIVNIIYNYGYNSDICISFVKLRRDKYKISCGLSNAIRKRHFSTVEWQDLNVIPHINDTLCLKYLTLTERGLVILIEKTECCEINFIQLLCTINDWARSKYPIVVGIDDTSEYLNIPGVNVLSTVLELKSLKFIFYNFGLRNINYLNIKSQEDNSEYPVGYLEGVTKYENFLNSMIELRKLLEDTDKENAKIYNEVLSAVLNEDAIDYIANKSMNIFDNTRKTYLFKTNTKYRMGYSLSNGGEYVKFINENNRYDTEERYVLLTKDTELMLNGELITKLNRIDVTKCKFPNIKWIEGVPGCGKSHYIVDNHNPGEDLILCQTRAGVKNIREIVFNKMNNRITRENLYLDYRTVASYIINTNNKKYKKVFLDEGMMMHAGYIGYIAHLSGADEVVVVGDSRQIPYIERSPIKTKFSKLADFCDPNTYINVTIRCPVDVSYAISNYYENIVSANPIYNSIQPISKDGEFYSIEPGSLVLTFTQKEKCMLLNELKKYIDILKIHTIHEAQGLTSKHVVLVRINSKPNEIYNSIPHAIVALTRHKESFKYLTTGEDDAVEKLIKKATSKEPDSIFIWNLNRLNSMDAKKKPT